jgi:uracil-DNA glycosylase family 4
VTTSNRAERRRLVDAMDIGPLWLSREHVDVADSSSTVAFGDAREATIANAPFEALAQCVAECRACRLADSRTQTVFGVGARQPAWLVIGEAPGADEDARGEPFVGQAGKLLDAMLVAVGLRRDENAFIANVLKCRPPGNRDPSNDEVAACRPFLMRQIELLKPGLILIVGRIATQALLDPDTSLARARGKVHRLDVGGRSIPTVVTYHPAYLLRTPQDKAKAWSDLCFARRVYRDQAVAAA